LFQDLPSLLSLPAKKLICLFVDTQGEKDMNKKSQYWTFLAGLLILSLLLAACGGAAKQEETSRLAPFTSD
jgi:hypothetical protein